MKNICDEDRKRVVNELLIKENEGIILATMHPIPKNLDLPKNETVAFLKLWRLYQIKFHQK